MNGGSNLEDECCEFVEVDPTGRYGRYNEILGKGASKTVYRLKHRKVNIRAVKHWCRQILRGLYYLHSHDPPIIHRDLKCDNIFVNGNQGEVKIGDLGLAAILRKSHAAHCVGTPEFMAPEVYEEEYNELVDIYSFGMCVLEMVTFEYPYSECNYPAEIYKKVISGKKPDALYNVKDPEVRQFIEKCLTTVSLRLSAKELLDDPFLQIDDYDNDMRLTDYQSELDGLSPLMKQPFLEHYTSDSSFINGFSNGIDMESYDWGYHSTDVEASGIELFEHHDDDHFGDVDITIKGKKQDDGSIFLRLRIADKEGRIRNIYFPFDVELDTALSVATEMVGELDITDQDVTSIADMIDGEIASLVPGWKTGPGIVETPRFSDVKLCRNCASTHTSVGSLLDILSNNPGAFNSPFFQCPNGCEAAMHGRFEEITYQADSTHEHDHNVTEASDKELNEQHQVELWDHCERVEISSHECHENSGHLSPPPNKGENIPDNVQRDFRWLKAKFQLELREIRDHQLGMLSKSALSHHFSHSLLQNLLLEHDRSNLTVLEDFQKSCPVSRIPRARNSEAIGGGLYDANNLCAGSLLPSTLHRTTSLPVDAVYI